MVSHFKKNVWNVWGHVENRVPWDEKLLIKVFSIFNIDFHLRNIVQIHIHDSYEALHSYVPAGLLPEEYGGNQGNAAQLHSGYTAPGSLKNFNQNF